MQNFIYTTDWHLSDRSPINRQGDIVNDSFIKLEELFGGASDNDCIILHGGDMFDDAKPSYLLLNRLIELIKKYKVEIHYVFGNTHDVIGNNIKDESTAIHTLLKSHVIHPLTKLEYGNTVIFGHSYDRDLKKSFSIRAKDTDKYNVVVSHNAITPKSLPFDHILIKDIDTNVNLFLCGHIHRRFDVDTSKGTRFLNPGCLIRRSIDERDVEPSFIKFNENTYEIRNLLKVKQGIFTLNQKDIKLEDLTKTISDVKIEAKDIESHIKSLDIKQEVKDECLKRLEQAKGKISCS